MLNFSFEMQMNSLEMLIFLFHVVLCYFIVARFGAMLKLVSIGEWAENLFVY